MVGAVVVQQPAARHRAVRALVARDRVDPASAVRGQAVAALAALAAVVGQAVVGVAEAAVPNARLVPIVGNAPSARIVRNGALARTRHGRIDRRIPIPRVPIRPAAFADAGRGSLTIEPVYITAK